MKFNLERFRTDVKAKGGSRLAEAANIAPTALYGFLEGKNSLSIPKMFDLATAAGFDPSDFLRWIDP